MSHDLPDDWYEEHDGQRLVLNSEKVATEIERLREALTDIQKEAMTLKPPRPTWYYDRAQNALTNSNEPLVRNGLTLPPQTS